MKRRRNKKNTETNKLSEDDHADVYNALRLEQTVTYNQFDELLKTNGIWRLE